MATRSAISVGFPSPNYVAETGTRDAILPGEYLAQTIASPIPAPAQRPWRHVALATLEDETEPWFPPRRGAVPTTPPPRLWQFREDEPDAELWRPPRHGTAASVIPPPTAPKPWLQHHLFGEDEESDLWLRRQHSTAPPFVPPPPQLQKPWLRHEFPEPEPDEWMAVVRRHDTGSAAPPSKRLRPYLLINL